MLVPEPVFMEIREYAEVKVLEEWEDPSEWKCFRIIIHRESRWTPDLLNEETGAFGLGQIVGSQSYTEGDSRKQIRKAIGYIKHKYVTACKALRHHYRRGWY